MTIVSIMGGWASGVCAPARPATRHAAEKYTAARGRSPLFDSIKTLVQDVGEVASRRVPLGKVHGRVEASGQLTHAARNQQERAADGVRPERRAKTGDGCVGGNRGAKCVRDTGPQRPHPSQRYAQREGGR